MRFTLTRLSGLVLVDLEPIADDRGFFARSFCQEEFKAAGLDPCVAQCNVSFNQRRGTLRGLHWAVPPHAEAKLVRCTAGAVYDVAVDIRAQSPTYRQWEAFELTAENRRALYIPVGFAHGFQTLTGKSELLYQMSAPYNRDCARGARWDDPAFEIRWPVADPSLSPRDAGFPAFDQTAAL